MLLGYKRSIGGTDPYFYGIVDGHEFKFIRVVAGVALPILDRVKGAVIVVGENYRPSGPASWHGIEAMAGEWNFVENALSQYRRDLKFDHVIVDNEEARKVMWQMTGLQYGMNEIPLTTYAAPHYAASEIGRSLVDEMMRENRLNLGSAIIREMEMEPQMAALAIQYAISWMRDHKSYYTPMRQEERAPGRILGIEGL